MFVEKSLGLLRVQFAARLINRNLESKYAFGTHFQKIPIVLVSNLKVVSKMLLATKLTCFDGFFVVMG